MQDKANKRIKFLQIIAFVVPATLLIASLGCQMDWWSYAAGLEAVHWATWFGLVILGLSFFAFLFFSIKSQSSGQKRALVAFIVCLIPVALVLHKEYLAQKMPSIHDISTDLIHPPVFFAPIPHRLANSNSLNYPGEAVAKQQEEAYPDVKPLILTGSPSDILQHVLRLVHRNRWQLISVNPDKGEVQAVARSFWFGFKDDVVIRITPQGTSSRVDMRSVSRLGRNDLGTNAQRIEEFMQQLAAVHNQDKARKKQ
jgi:uncharacterized protein (DUF1499 family)